METNKRLELYAVAIAFHQMHGHQYAEFFLEQQGVANNEAKKLMCWASAALPQVPSPEFENEYRRALLRLLYFSEFSQHAYEYNCQDVPAPTFP